MTEVRKHIRGLDEDLFLAARIAALKAGKNIGQWINEAIAEKLRKEGKK